MSAETQAGTCRLHADGTGRFSEHDRQGRLRFVKIEPGCREQGSRHLSVTDRREYPEVRGGGRRGSEVRTALLTSQPRVTGVRTGGMREGWLHVSFCPAGRWCMRQRGGCVSYRTLPVFGPCGMELEKRYKM